MLALFCLFFSCLPVVDITSLSWTTGQKIPVSVTVFVDPGDFWCQPVCDADALVKLGEDIAAACEAGVAPASLPTVGSVCCARYSEDEFWYRARVLGHEGNVCKVCAHCQLMYFNPASRVMAAVALPPLGDAAPRTLPDMKLSFLGELPLYKKNFSTGIHRGADLKPTVIGRSPSSGQVKREIQSNCTHAQFFSLKTHIYRYL